MNRCASRNLLCCVLVVTVHQVVAASSAQPNLASIKLPAVHVMDRRLPNGLRVLILEDHHAPVYSLVLTYKVGSRDETVGKTGIAHLMEHLMFKGSEQVASGEHFFLVSHNGGGANASTTPDRTMYYDRMPANQLDLGLFLEADRMQSLVLTKGGLENQRQAVGEERRQALDNRPYGKAFIKVEELAYSDFAYRHSTIGTPEDLDSLTLDDVRTFAKIYYAPNNAVLAIVGDFSATDTMERVRKYFGSIKPQKVPRRTVPQESGHTQGQRATLEDQLARTIRLDYAWLLPTGRSPDTLAARVLAMVLAGNDSTRLHKKLVIERKISSSVAAFVDERAGPSLFRLIADVRGQTPPEQAERAIEEELARLVSSPVSEAELERAKAGLLRLAVEVQESSLQRAQFLANFGALYDNPMLANIYFDRMAHVRSKDISRVARLYLTGTNHALVVTLPKQVDTPPTSPRMNSDGRQTQP